MIKPQGFTLIELVATLSITGVLAMLTMDIINFPLQSYLQVNERALLLASAQEIEGQLRHDLEQSDVTLLRVSADKKKLTIVRDERFHVSLDNGSLKKSFEDSINNPSMVLDQRLSASGELSSLRIHEQPSLKYKPKVSTITYFCHRDDTEIASLKLERFKQSGLPKVKNSQSVEALSQSFSTLLASCHFESQQRGSSENTLIAIRFEIEGQQQRSVPFFFQFAVAKNQ